MREMKDWYLKNFRATKFKKITVVICLLSLSLCACKPLDTVSDKLSEFAGKVKTYFTGQEEEPEIKEDLISFENEIKVFDEVGELVDSETSVIDEAEREDNTTQLSSGNLASVALNAFDGGSSTYAYNKLSPAEQTAYREILAVLNDVLDNVILSGKDLDAIDMAFRAVMIDHPEIFYVNGYSIGKYMVDGELDKVSFGGTYTMTPEEVEQKRVLVDEYVESVLLRAPVSDDYEKIKYVYDYVIENCTYDLDAENNQNVLSVVEGGRTVCQGYAKMVQLLLEKMDVFCTLVNGSANSSDDPNDYEAHVWNIVRCNGEYYNLDATWGDSVFRLIDEAGGVSPRMDVNYEFFLVPDSYLANSHIQEPIVDMPVCNCIDDNYYVREGLYFEEVDEDQLAYAFDREYSKGSDILFIKAMDEYVYEELEEYLFTEHNVFTYTGTDNVRYVNVDSRNLIMISL